MDRLPLLIACLVGWLPGLAAADTGFVQLPDPTDGSYLRSAPAESGRHWGRPALMRSIVRVAREWNRRHGDRYRLVVGDISRRDGRVFPPHKTHRDGLAVDIVTRPNICHVDWKDQALTQELAQLFVALGARQILYNHPQVVRRLAEVREWPKHDDHFHVVVDPGRVPEGDAPLVVAAPEVASGARLGPAQLPARRGKRSLVLGWRLLDAPPGWLRAYQVEVARDPSRPGRLADTGRVRGQKAAHALRAEWTSGPVHWRVHLFGPRGQSLVLGWQRIELALDAPVVTLTGPPPATRHVTPPLLRWTVTPAGRAVCQIELARRPRGTRIVWRSDELPAGTTSHRLALALRPGTLYWRVVVDDRLGHTVASDWAALRIGAGYKRPAGRHAQVTAEELNLRKGPGTRHAVVGVLEREQTVRILATEGRWARVAVELKGRPVEGWVHRDYLRE